MRRCAQYQKGELQSEKKTFWLCDYFYYLLHPFPYQALVLGFIYLTGHNFSPFLRQWQINLSSLCIHTSAILKDKAQPSLGIITQVFSNQMPKERAHGLDGARSSTLSKPAFGRRVPCETPLLLQLPFHSSVWLILSGFSAACSTSLFCTWEGNCRTLSNLSDLHLPITAV